MGDQVTIIGVAGRGEADAIDAFIDDTGVGGFDHAVDDDGSIWAEFGIVSQPSFVFVDDSGETFDHLGPLGVAGLTERVEALIAT